MGKSRVFYTPAFRLIISLVILSCLTCGVFSTSPAVARQAGPISMTATFGYEQSIKLNTWAPVRVFLENDGPGFEGYIQVNFLDTDDKNIFRYPIELPTGANKEFTIYAFVSSYLYEAEVTLFSGSQREANTRVQVNSRNVTDRFFGIVAETPSVFNILNLIDPDNGDAFTANIELSDIPEFSQSLASLDVLIISNVDTGILSNAQRESLAAWVASGGRLLVACGPDWQKTTAGLLDLGLLPLIPEASIINNDWLPLTKYSPNKNTLSGNAVVAKGDLSPDGKIIAVTTSQIPIITQKRYGAGEVFFLAADPALAPLNGWADMEDVYRNLIAAPLSAPIWLHGISDWYSAANAAQTFPNLNIPPVLLVCSFLLIYMLVLGPVNYLIVRKSKRRALGWFTTSLMILIFSLVVLISGGLSRSRQPALNRLSVVQVWPDTPWSRIDSVVGIYSPFRATYQVNFTGAIQAHSLLAAPNPSTRKMEIYQNGSGGTIRDLRIEVSGIRHFSLQGTIPSLDIENDIILQLNRNGAKLFGTLRNNSPIKLESAALFTPDEIIRLGNIDVGDTKEIQQEITDQTGRYNQPPNPALLKPASNLAAPPSSFRYAYGTMYFPIEEIIGTIDYYKDRSSYRKYSLVSSILNNTNYPSTVGSEIYLSGWSGEPVLPVSLSKIESENQDTTLFLIRLEPRMEYADQVIQIPPGLFAWSPLEFSGSPPSAYQMQLYGAEIYSLGFRPRFPIDYKDIESLVLHLESPGLSGPVSEVEVSIWDYHTETWEKLSDLIWSDNNLEQPDLYVMPGGQISIQFRGLGQYIEITRSDFSITVTK